MKDAYADFQRLHQSWKYLRQHYSNQGEFEQFGLKGSKADDFDGLFAAWDQALAKAASRTKSTGPDDTASEAILRFHIEKVFNLVSPAAQNGYQWLFQNTPFVTDLANLQGALLPIVDRRFFARKAVLDIIKSNLNDDINSIQEAAPLASNLVNLETAFRQKVDAIDETLSVTEAAKGKIVEAAQAAAGNQALAAERTQDISDRKASLESAVGEATSLLGSAKQELDALAALRDTAAAELRTSTEAVTTANKKLHKAIEDVNRQGLAGSYNARAIGLQYERTGWLFAFCIALVYIALVVSGAVEKLLDIEQPADALYLERLLHLLPLASPGIWLGWFAARNAGQTARIQHDYYYKVATAQAFEAHKKEAAASGGADLSLKLLETVIRSYLKIEMRAESL